MAEGLHILANFYECRKNVNLLIDKKELEKICVKMIKGQDLQVIEESFYKFGEDGGITGFIMLAESHFSIHTWPEKDNFIALDIYVCNVKNDNSGKVKEIFKYLKLLFEPKRIKKKFVLR
ncbi:MAG: adenosylmethionine decarboxylase [Nanoarchaeota archaeon]